MAIVRQGDDETDTTQEDIDRGNATGWSLLYWATRSCFDANIIPESDLHIDPAPWFEFASPQPGPYYNLHQTNGPATNTSCDVALFMQEVLLCAADRLAQIGDSPGTVTWELPATSGGEGPDEDHIEITIPPQATDDVFIARDIAMNALAHVVRLDHETPDTVNITSCAQEYAELAGTGAVTETVEDYVLSTHRQFIDGDAPVPVSTDEGKAAGRRRVARKVNLLTSAARLVQDLVERSVRDDISGAERRRTGAADDLVGARSAWGVDEGQSPYNTLRHALRVLYGRLEIGNHRDPSYTSYFTGEPGFKGDEFVWDPQGAQRDDPKCQQNIPESGTAALDLITVLTAGQSARWNDLPPKTRGESLALGLLDRDGIVVSPQALALADESEIRSAVENQLLLAAAERSSSTYSDYVSSDAGRALQATLDELDTAEIRFALARTWDVFSLLTGGEVSGETEEDLHTSTRTLAENHGLLVDLDDVLPGASDDIVDLGGIIVAGGRGPEDSLPLGPGLPRQDLQADVLLRLRASQITGQCGVFPVSPASPENFYWRIVALNHMGLKSALFQNPFLLGEAVRRQLSFFGWALEETEDSELEETVEFTRLAVSEIREWAGRGTILREYDSSAELDKLYLANLKPSDFGASTLEEVKDRIVLVRNGFFLAKATTEAECLAGLRRSCPASVDEPEDPDELEALETAGVIRRATGFDDPHYPTTHPDGVIQLNYAHLASNSFVVLLPRGASPGAVLATMRGTNDPADYVVETLSPLQRELTNRIFGVGPSESTTRSCTNIAPPSVSRDYCIEGMKRDQFVPLANELTSGGAGGEDSWRHYLTLAEQAAAKADELGREMIEIGLQDDIRKEAASEAVGELCGAFGTTETVTTDGTSLSLPPDDKELRACIGGEKVDIAFLRNDPLATDEFAALAASQSKTVDQAIWDTYCDDSIPELKRPPFCGRKSRGDKIEHAGLNYITSTAIPLSGTVEEACRPAFDAFSGGKPNEVEYGKAIGARYASVTGLGMAVDALRLSIELDGDWVLSMGNRPLMGSDDGLEDAIDSSGGVYTSSEVWPLCDSSCTGVGAALKRAFPEVGAAGGAGRYPSLRAEVERTLFYLGAMAGQIPANHITMPLPAANRANEAMSGPVPAPGLYGASEFSGSSQYFLTNDGYVGYLPWSPEEADHLGSIGTFDAGYASERAGLETGWRQRLYAGVAGGSGRYLAVRAGNASIAFDDSLIPGVLGRGLLRDWLAGLGQKFANDAVDLVGEVQQATFYTPGRFCRANGKYTQGRHVCSAANVSPVFYTTYDAWSDQGCDGDTTGDLAPLPVENLVATTTVENVGYSDPDHWLSVYAISGYPGESGCDDECEHPSGWPFIWTALPDNDCSAEDVGLPWDIEEGEPCSHWAWQLAGRPYYWPTTKRRRLSHERLMPSQCSPAERVEMFLSKDLADKAHALRTLVQGISLSCIRESLHLQTTLSEVPPAIETVEDIRSFEAWLKRVGHAVDDIANLYYVVDLPKEVVAVALDGGSNVGAVTAGARGELLLELEKQLRLVESGFSGVGATLQQIGTEIDKARLDLEAVGIGAEGHRLQLAAANIENNRQRALATVSMFMGVAKYLVTASLGAVDGALQPGAAATSLLNAEEQIMAAAVNLGAAESMDRVLSAQAQNAADSEENQEAQVVVTLSEAIAGLFQSVGDGVTGVENGVSSILQTVTALQQNESKARIAVAKAAGADFVQLQDGSAPVPLHVNTVYRRQFNVLKKRYEKALESAKRSAYLARLSMEQRLGIRLDELHQGIGPLEAPAVWVDSLCTVQGVDYAKLRSAEPNAEPDEEEARIEGFADQYIGDYVAKLKEFLEFYTLEFPFRESDDVAVVSLREDLPGSLSSCLAQAPNLLCYSDRLDAKSSEFGQPVQVATQGWGTTGCSASACIELLGGGALRNPVPMSDPPETVPLSPPDGFGGVTWLRTIPRPLNTEPGVTEEEQDHQVWKEKSPAAIVYQTVSLRAGERYVLSWWDMARDADGGVALEVDVRRYQAAAYDADWKFLAGDSFEPPAPEDGETWQGRRQIEFVAYQDGDYHVAFSAGLPDVDDASVAIANVQLENAPGNSGGATAYVPTSASRQRLTGQCPSDSAEQFRQRFLHRCDQLGCWFELRDVLAVDTELLNQGATSLLGQVAPGNFNYRTGGVAVNLVGTGILDCSKDGSSSCYGSGYVEYDLQHVAYSVPLEDYESNVRCFDFGAGNIRGGKALAAERFITLPMSSADKEMVNSSPFLKPEFSGRPLSGSYRLRIKDSPALVWEQVDDVQIVLNYNYWSRVERSPGN